MTSDELKEIIKNHKPSSVRYYDQKSYKIGVNSAIYQYPAHEAPDNRLPVPFVRRAVKITKGYFAKVGNITYSSPTEEGVKTGGWFEENLADIFDANNEEMETAAMFEDSITYGQAWELHWFNAEGGFKFTVLPVDQCIPIWSDDIIPELIGFVWHRRSGDIERATFYDSAEYVEFTKEVKADDWTVDIEKSGKHLYGRVPVLQALTDRDRRNLFDHCLPLIDFYDKMASMVANEHEKFAESILLLRDAIDGVTKDENGMTDIDKVNRWRIIDHLGENVATAAQYLERNVNDTFINNTLDRLERLIYEMLCLFNPNDDSFATASGIAQAYKLLGFELAVADMESYFSQFLQARIKLIANHGSGRIAEPENADYVTIHFARNLPFDIERMAQIVTMLAGGKQVVSRETMLKWFPATMIDANELEKVNAESAIANPDQGIEGMTTGVELGEPATTLEAVKLTGIQITSANEIIQKVADGTITRDAGINQLMVFLGLTESQANSVMGAQ